MLRVMRVNLTAIYEIFPTSESCLTYLEAIRWNGRPECPYCGASRFSRLNQESRYHCNACNASYSVTAKTVFHRTRVDMRKWFLTIFLMSGEGDDPSVRQLAAIIEVDKNTACYLAMRIRHARVKEFNLLTQIAERIRGSTLLEAKNRDFS